MHDQCITPSSACDETALDRVPHGQLPPSSQGSEIGLSFSIPLDGELLVLRLATANRPLSIPIQPAERPALTQLQHINSDDTGYPGAIVLFPYGAKFTGCQRAVCAMRASRQAFAARKAFRLP